MTQAERYEICKRGRLEDKFDKARGRSPKCGRCSTNPLGDDFVEYLSGCGCCLLACKPCSERPNMAWWMEGYEKLHVRVTGKAGYQGGSGCPRCLCTSTTRGTARLEKLGEEMA